MEGSESENSLAHNYDPTLGGLIEAEDFLNGHDLLGSSDAFYTMNGDETGEMFSDIFNEEDGTLVGDEDLDEYEENLELSDFLDFSSNDESAKAEMKESFTEGGLSDVGGEDGDEEDDCMPNNGNGNATDAMLSIWDKVSVTAFRKRQMQHSQKMTYHQSNGGSSHNYGYSKGKEARLADTITPNKKRKVRQKFLANNRAAQNKKFAHR